MATLPTISAPSVQRAQYAGVPVSLENALAPIRGSQAIAGAIGQTGQVLGEFAVRTAKIREDGILAEQQRQQEAAFGQFQADLANIPDPDQWQAAWDKRANELQKSVAMSQNKLGPDGKRRSQAMFKDWSVQNSIRVKTQSSLAIVKEAKQSLTTQAVELAQQGDLEGARGIIARLDSEHHALSKGELADWDSKLVQTAENAMVQSAIMEDPFQASEDLRGGKWESLTPALRNRYLLQAREREADVRENIMRGFDEQIYALERGDAGVNPVTLERQINEAPRITAQQKRFMLQRLSKTQNPKQQAAAVATLWDMAEAIDPSSPTAKLEITQIREALMMFDADMKRDVIRVLDRKADPSQSKTNRPTQALAALKAMYDGDFLGRSKIGKPPPQIETETVGGSWYAYTPLGFMLGMDRKKKTVPVLDNNGNPIPLRDELGRPITDTTKYQKNLKDFWDTKAFYGDVVQRFERWYAANPNSTVSEQLDQINGLVSGKLDETGVAALYSGLTGFTDTEDDDGN